MACGIGTRIAACAVRWDSCASRDWRQALLAICLVALAARAASILVLATPVESDASEYLCMARNLAEAGKLQDCDFNYAYLSALYPMLLGGLFLLFGVHLWLAYLLNLLLGTLSVLLAAIVGKELARSPLAGLCGAGLLALYLEAILYADYLAKENLVIAVMLLQLWLVLRWRQRPRTILALLLGVTLAAQALAGVASLALLPALVAYLLGADTGWRALFHHGICAVAVAGLCLGPWLVRNQQMVGAPVLNTNGGVNLYIGNNAKSGLDFMRLWDTPIGPSWHALHDGGQEYEADRTLRRLAIGYMSDHPLQTAERWGARFVAFWAPPVQKLADPATGRAERLIRVGWLLQYLVLLLLALVPPLARSAPRPQLVLLYGSILLSAAAYAPFFIIYRFRFPVMVLVCLAAGWGAAYLWRSFGHAAAGPRALAGVAPANGSD